MYKYIADMYSIIYSTIYFVVKEAVTCACSDHFRPIYILIPVNVLQYFRPQQTLSNTAPDNGFCNSPGECQCHPGYNQTTLCQTELNYCSNDPCQNGGKCIVSSSISTIILLIICSIHVANWSSQVNINNSLLQVIRISSYSMI